MCAVCCSRVEMPGGCPEIRGRCSALVHSVSENQVHGLGQSSAPGFCRPRPWEKQSCCQISQDAACIDAVVLAFLCTVVVFVYVYSASLACLYVVCR